jgi:L-asparaginase/Glu-tRNA(Gln) amidotransferase subunit D
MSHVAYFALGGTISMTNTASGGAVPRLTSVELLSAVGELATEVQMHDLTALPGARSRSTTSWTRSKPDRERCTAVLSESS